MAKRNKKQEEEGASSLPPADNTEKEHPETSAKAEVAPEKPSKGKGPKYRLVLEVLKPRYGEDGQKLKPGDRIVLEEDCIKTFRKRLLRLKSKTTIVEGEMPNLKKEMSALQTKKKPAKVVDGKSEGKSYASYQEFSREKTDEEVKAEIAVSADLICAECGKGPFKSADRLRKHMERAHSG